MDVEALQAQIDLSNSIAYDLVSSWLKPSQSSSATSVSHTISKELEEYAKRPPRLGLGATVSRTTLATSREAARLKGKLVGQKRRRDDSDDHGRTMSAQGPNNGEDDEDEGESRSTAISTKKNRVNKSLGKKSGDVKVLISPKKKSTEEGSFNLPSTSTHLSVGPPNNTLPSTTASVISSPTSLAGSRPTSSFPLAQSPVSSQTAPLLNLFGPPSEHVDVIPAHPQEIVTQKKKKRRRRRGKGRKNREGEEGA